MLSRISLMLTVLFGGFAGMLAAPALAQNESIANGGQALPRDAITYVSHPPMRPLPVASNRPLGDPPAFYVDPDPSKGDDNNTGGETTPWRTLRESVPKLKPGHTLYLRAGTYYEGFKIDHAFENERPITIRGYPNEVAIIDAGIREFYEDPKGSWEHWPDGHPDEYRSTRQYDLTFTDDMLSGNFGDSMVPLFRYKHVVDLRSDNELWRKCLSHHGEDPDGIYIYAGPGIWYDKSTGYIHARLSHTKLAVLGEDNYGGETNPRKVPLIIAGRGAGVNIKDAKHIRLQDVVIRGANRVALSINTSQDIEVDGVTIYAGWFGLATGPKYPEQLRNIRISNCAIRGYSAPWHSRHHQKYRANDGPLVEIKGTDVVVMGCEMTDHHDGMRIMDLEDGEIHNNLFDNFTDDGIEVGGLRESGIRRIHGNLVMRCYQCLTTHGGSALKYVEPGSGNYVYRNVIDARRGTYMRPPRQDELHLGDDYGGWNNEPKIIADHGNRVWARYYVYHNTFVRRSKVPNKPYGFTWGFGTADTHRQVHNNIFLQVNGEVGLNLPDSTHDFSASNNLFWSLEQGAPEQGGCVGDVLADPQLVSFSRDLGELSDFALRPRSPAINAGVELEANWPDPLRADDDLAPDIGALPYGVDWIPPGLGH